MVEPADIYREETDTEQPRQSSSNVSQEFSDIISFNYSSCYHMFAVHCTAQLQGCGIFNGLKSGFRFRLLCSLGLLCLWQSLIVRSLNRKGKSSRNGKLMHQHWKYGTGDNSLQSPGPNALKGFVRILQNSNFERKLISLETFQWRVWYPLYNSVAIFTQFSSHLFID